MTNTIKASIDIEYDRYGERDQVTLTGSYSGGAYIDISIDGAHPNEVINVWDYETGKPVIEFTELGVEFQLLEWIDDNDRQEETDTGNTYTTDHPRTWLRAYIENSRY